jgi:hypothetical protein
MSAITATIMEINLLEGLFMRRKYKNLSHKKKELIELIALSVCGKSTKYSSISDVVMRVSGIMSIKFHGDVKYFIGP